MLSSYNDRLRADFCIPYASALYGLKSVCILSDYSLLEAIHFRRIGIAQVRCLKIVYYQ